jgi:hypothetical protein
MNPGIQRNSGILRSTTRADYSRRSRTSANRVAGAAIKGRTATIPPRLYAERGRRAHVPGEKAEQIAVLAI